MKVVLFCGGRGLRLQGHSRSLPKPMVTVGDRPILWHIMRYYAHFGHRDFVLCLGYQAHIIREYFERYGSRISTEAGWDGDPDVVRLLEQDIDDWRIRFVDTGLDAPVGQRLRAAGAHLDGGDLFLANYGDVLTDAPLPDLIERFVASGKLAAFVAVRPRAYTFHLVRVGDDDVVQRIEDVATSDNWINGGYFMLRREVIDEIRPGEDLVPDVLPRLIARQQVLAYRYDGFWAPMDTVRDWQILTGYVADGTMPWAVWRPEAEAGAAPVPDETVLLPSAIDGVTVPDPV